MTYRIPVIPPKPDLPNGHSNWSTDDYLESIDPGGWVDDKRSELDIQNIRENLFEEYLQLLRNGQLIPGTTFEMYEKEIADFETDIISKIKRKIEDKKKIEGIASLLALSADRI